MTAALFLAALGVLPGCGATRHAARTPEGALSAYVHALERGDVDRAYDSLSPEAQLGMTRQDFARLAQSSPESTRSFAALLVEGNGQPKTVVTTTCGTQVLLVLEDGQWRVAPATIDLFPTRTPEESARSLILAFDAQRFDVLHRLMPEEKRKELPLKEFQAMFQGDYGETMTTAIDALRLALEGAPFEVMGNRASLPYGKGRVLGLVLERGSWRVESF